MFTRSVWFVILSSYFWLSSTGQAQEAAYDYSDISPYAATVIGTPIALQADLPKHIPVKDRELAVFPDRAPPTFFDRGKICAIHWCPKKNQRR